MSDLSGSASPSLAVPPPGSRSRELARRLARVESRNVTYLSDEFPIFWDRAEGSNVWDADGNRFVDLTAAFGVSAAGHGHPRVVEAVAAQAGRLLHGMGDVHPASIKVELLERLARLAPQEEARAVLTTSGSEAVEVALKTAHLKTGRPGVIAFTGAYHGLGYGALAVTDGPRFRAPFERQLNPWVLRAPYPDPFRPCATLLEAAAEAGLARAAVSAVDDILDSEAGARVGAVVLEPIQGRGGQVVPPRGFLAGLARVCRDRGVLLVLDEVLTGFGRTGHRFACESEDVIPDLLCVGKSFSGGMPIGACIGSAEVMDAWPVSTGEAMHTSTFLGHPVACAAAIASLELIEEQGLTARAREEGARWLEELRAMAAVHPGVGDVRGRGFMIGVELVRAGDPPDEGGALRPDRERAGRVMVEALQRGWIVLGGGRHGNVLSLTPPLTIERELLDAATLALDQVLAASA